MGVREESDHGNKQSGTDKSPYDGEMRSADVYRKQLRKMERSGQPCSDNRTNESKTDGNEASAARKSGYALADGTHQSGDQDQEKKINKAHGSALLDLRSICLPPLKLNCCFNMLTRICGAK